MGWRGIFRGDRSSAKNGALEERFQRFLGRQRGVEVRIDDVSVDEGALVFLLRPTPRPTSGEAAVLGSFIKARLSCEFGNAATRCRHCQAVRSTETLRLIQQEGRTFEEPSWFLRSAGAQLGPMGFTISWDEAAGVFYARLEPMIMSLDPRPGVMQRWDPALRELANGYADAVKRFAL